MATLGPFRNHILMMHSFQVTPPSEYQHKKRSSKDLVLYGTMTDLPTFCIEVNVESNLFSYCIWDIKYLYLAC